MKLLFIYLIYPGALFTALLGMMASWLDRKVTARLQWRVGPPWYQSFADIIKLWGKETAVPEGGLRMLFACAPIAGVAGVGIAAALLGAVALDPLRDIPGSVLVMLVLLMAPAASLICGGTASNDELASLGARREIRLAIATQVPFLLAVLTPVIRAGGALGMGEIVVFQRMHGAALASLSGIISCAVALVCMQSLLRLTPFDCPEADTEVNAGPLILYSGRLLALFKMMKMMMLAVVPLFLITLFMGGVALRGRGIAVAALHYLLLVLLTTVLRNINPRVRIDQAQRFFLIPLTVAALAGVTLAMTGY